MTLAPFFIAMETYNPAKKYFWKNMAMAQKNIKTLEPIKEQYKQKVRNGVCLEFGNIQGCNMKKVLVKFEEWHKKFRFAYGNNRRRPLPQKLNSSPIESEMKNIFSKNDENCKSKLPMATSIMETTTSPVTTTMPKITNGEGNHK